MLRSFKLSPALLFGVVLALLVGELLSGTGLYFASMMALVMFCIGVTYNLAGGLATITGIVFTVAAMRWLVIAQFAKVVLRQPADKYIEAPELTVTVYAVFFLLLIGGTVCFSAHSIEATKAS